MTREPSRIEIHGDTIVGAFRENLARRADRPAMRRRAGDGWETLTWADYGRGVAEVLAGLAELGVEPGQHVGILSGNRVEWHLADQAILAGGGVTVPVYPTSPAPQVRHVLGHGEARVCFAETREQLAKVLEVRDELPRLLRVVLFDPGAGPSGDPFVTSFDELREIGRARLGREPSLFEDRASAVGPDQLATLVYTSGTTGLPKGAMITHANVMWTLRNATMPFEIRPGERLLSFLPLSHIAERMMSDFLPIAIGGETWFAQSLATVARDLRDCRPTVFFAVPRVWEKLREAVVAKLAEQGGLAKRALDLLVALGLRRVEREQAGGALDRGSALAWRALDRLIGARIRRELGLDQAHVTITAAAPIHPDLIRWFHAIGLPLIELYGQTEDCGPTSTNVPWRNRIGTVGPAIPGVSIRIADDGEILVQGGNVCAGYFKDERGTAELIDEEGWMHSGDLGALDEDGSLRITGRKKDLIINAAGKNIAPQEIEVDLRFHPPISQAVVIGDGRRYLTALITLDPEALAAWAAERGKLPEVEALSRDPDLIARVGAAIEEVNARRSRAEAVKKFRILPHDLTIAGGELTPTMKVKRNVVNERYSGIIEEMYAEEPGRAA